MSKSGGVFQFFGGRMTSRGQCPRGGACPRSKGGGGGGACGMSSPRPQEILYPRLLSV